MNQPSHVVVIGASAGGVNPLLDIAGGLPAGFPAAVGIVLHVGAQPSILPELLSARGPLPALHPADGEPLRPATIYVAPPDHHLAFTGDAVRVGRGPRENHARPAIDPLFRSAAVHWRERAIGVVLSGHLDDGTVGLQAIKQCGGHAVVQDPAEAVEPSMPRSALAWVGVDHCVPVAGIAPLLMELAALQPPAGAGPGDLLRREQAMHEGRHAIEHLAAAGEPSPLTCPDCGGGLWELRDRQPLRYRCHTGHAFTVRALASAQADAVEQALWTGIRALDEREMLLRRMADIAEATGDAAQARVGREQADTVRSRIEQLRRLAAREPGSAG